MEHGEAPGVASLLKGQGLFRLRWHQGSIGRNCRDRVAETYRAGQRDQALAQFGYLLIRNLLDLDRRRSDFRMGVASHI